VPEPKALECAYIHRTELCDASSRVHPSSTKGRMDREGTVVIPDVVQTAFDFLGMVKKQKVVVILTDIEEDLNGSINISEPHPVSRLTRSIQLTL
jgi:hypothetical protein